MASSGYTRWINAGKPYTLMNPAKALQRILKGHGLTVYDYPDNGHLTANTPEDHTPFSATGWPIPSAFGVGHALDVMPRTNTAAGRAENAAIARRLIRDRDANHPGVRWIKYINWTDENGVCRQESWKDTRVTRSSTDKGHIHISGRSDHDTYTGADNYDPMGVTMSDLAVWRDEPGDSKSSRLTQGAPGYAGHMRDTALAFAWQSAGEAREAASESRAAALETLETVKMLEQRVMDLTALVKALPTSGGSGGGSASVDGTYVITKVDHS